MRMAEYELVAKLVSSPGSVELLLFRPDLGVEANVQQHVAQFLADVLLVVVHEGIAQLIGFFDGVGAQALVGLLAIPGAFDAQFIEHVQKSSEGG